MELKIITKCPLDGGKVVTKLPKGVEPIIFDPNIGVPDKRANASLMGRGEAESKPRASPELNGIVR